MTTEAPRTDVDPTDPTQQRRIAIPLLHSLPEQTLSPGETAGSLKVAVPLEVVEGQIDCVVRAEFVPHAYSDKVQATIYSPAFRVPVQNAVTVQLTANNLNLTGNMQTKFTGTVKRTAGFTGAVDVSLVNLPAGYMAPKVTRPRFRCRNSSKSSSSATGRHCRGRTSPTSSSASTTPADSLLQKDTPIATKVAPGQ